MKSSKPTLVIGASTNPERYSYLAMQKLTAYGHPVFAVGVKEGVASNVQISTEKKDIAGIDTVTLYINPSLQKDYYDYILSLHPKRIIFNPGTENAELFALAQKNNILPVEACTLVMLGTNQY